MQPLMYNIPLYKVFPTKIWRQYVTHADNIFNIGRSLVDKVCYFKLISWHSVATYIKNLLSNFIYSHSLYNCKYNNIKNELLFNKDKEYYDTCTIYSFSLR